MILSNPIALWALAGLAVPLVIHLLSNDRGRRLPFAAVRFIPGFTSRRLRSPSLSDWLLFVLRFLLLTVLVLLMAQPLLHKEVKLDGPVAVLVSPLALASGGQKALALAAEIAAQNNTNARMLAPDFPLAGLDGFKTVATGAWSLLAELETGIGDETAILILVADDPRETTVRKPVFRHRVEFSTISGPAPAPPLEPLRIGISASADRKQDALYLLAALDALQSSGLALTYSEVQTDTQALDYDLLIELDADRCRQPAAGQLLVCDGGQIPLSPGIDGQLVFDYAGQPFDLRTSPVNEPDAEVLLAARGNEPLASLRRSGQGALLTWHSRFHPEYAAVVGSWYFPGLLRDLIWNHRLVPGNDDGQVGQQPGQSIESAFIGLLLLLLWLLERWLSGRSNAKRSV